MVTGEKISMLQAAVGERLAWTNEKAEPLLVRLTPVNRARVMLALLALLVVGLALIGLAIVAGRYVLREVRKSHGPTPLREDDWYRKPLVPRDPPPRARDPE